MMQNKKETAMPKLIISLNGVVFREVQLTKERTSLGRRPYNDIVIDNLAVSGEHAILHMSGKDSYVEDLNSTNGTYVNGKTVRKQLLHHNDIVEVGNCGIQYVNEDEQTGTESPGAIGAAIANASIRVVSGASAGREMALLKEVTTIGKAGVAVAAITRKHTRFVLAHVEGDNSLTLNGALVGIDAVPLKDGDMIGLAGTQMQFGQR
jgi:FHA domain